MELIGAVTCGVVGWQAWETRKSAQAAARNTQHAEDANRISRDNAVSDKRPWILLKPSIGSGLTYNPKDRSWHIVLRFELTNIGHTPATRVSIAGSINPFMLGLWKLSPDRRSAQSVLAEQLRRLCETFEPMPGFDMGFGQVQFPKEERTHLFHATGDPATFDAAKESPSYGGQFLVLMAVTYGSTLSGTGYRTAQAFHLFRAGGSMTIDLNGEAIEQSELAFVRYVGVDGSIVT